MKAPESFSTRAATSSGQRAARHMAALPPIDEPTMVTRCRAPPDNTRPAARSARAFLKLDKADGLVNRAAVSSAVAAATASLADHVHCAGVPCG